MRYDFVGDTALTSGLPGWICLDCGEDKTIDEMATETPALQHAITGQRAGSCKECRA